MKKRNRSNYDCRCNGEAFVCKWPGNSNVNIASTFSATNHTASRMVREEGRPDISQPHLIRLRDGSVYQMGRLSGSYRPEIRSRKWRWPLWSNILNVSVVAACKIYHNLHPEENKTHFHFQPDIAIMLMKTSENKERPKGGKHAYLPGEVRFDRRDHSSSL